EKEAAIREAEFAARRASAAASEARESLAGWKVKLETAESRLEESVEIARNNFQRTPEGLLAIAEAGLDEEEMGEFTPRDIERRVEDLRRTRDQLGGVNMEAEEEAAEMEERLGAQVIEKEDLAKAIAKLRQGVEALNEEGRDRLVKAFEQVNEHFKALFTALFRGGQAELRLVDADDPLQAGLAAYDAGDWARAATLLHAARTQPGVDVGTAVYYEAAALAALGDSAGALSVLEAFDGGLAGHLLAGEARRLRDTLQERARDATNREMLRDNLEFEPADAVQEAEPR
ncbi:MAG: hypothetical protein KDB35_02470, partial [Acidimicrobiales bacterium]|nr:hypothetical protein [Acidimicrobiales bacterium]